MPYIWEDCVLAYLQAIEEDGDYMNDWLTYLPRRKAWAVFGIRYAELLGF